MLFSELAKLFVKRFLLDDLFVIYLFFPTFVVEY